MQPKSQTGLTDKARESLAGLLDRIVEDEWFILAVTRQYRWSVKGPNLYSLHRLFDEQRRQLDYWLEQVVERTKSMGSRTRKSSLEKKASTDDPESNAEAGLTARTMVGDLLHRHEEMARRLRHDIERLRDPGTAALLSRLMEFHETTAWMLRMVVSSDSDPERLG
jgi:starvation-inducible DNA-binding protein